MRFDDVWMQPWQITKLAELAADSPGTGEAIEIGVYQGYSAIPIANAICPAMLHVVDHWRGSSDFRPEMRKRDNFSIFISNIQEMSQRNFMIHNIDWRDFASGWSAPVRFLHLDAEHTKEEVSAQIGAFLPYMISGSVMAGDDYNWGGVHQGVNLHFPTSKVNVMHNKLWWVEFEFGERR